MMGYNSSTTPVDRSTWKSFCICSKTLTHPRNPLFIRLDVPQTQDYYNYTAVKYAKDAGHEHVVELLGGEEEGEGWEEVEEAYTGMDTGEEGEASGPTGGLWIRHTDPQTELAYYMNDETGERLFGKAIVFATHCHVGSHPLAPNR